MRFLIWLRVVDSHDRRVSLSALAFVASFVLLAVLQSAVMLGAFGLTALLYGHRRLLVHRGALRAGELEAFKTELAHATKQLQDSDTRLARVEMRLAIERNRGP